MIPKLLFHTVPGRRAFSICGMYILMYFIYRVCMTSAEFNPLHFQASRPFLARHLHRSQSFRYGDDVFQETFSGAIQSVSKSRCSLPGPHHCRLCPDVWMLQEHIPFSFQIDPASFQEEGGLQAPGFGKLTFGICP